MPTTIQSLKRSYKDVSMDGDQVDTASFLEATEGLLQVLGMSLLKFPKIGPEMRHAAVPSLNDICKTKDSLGSAFGVVKSDISGNITVRFSGLFFGSKEGALVFNILSKTLDHRKSDHTQHQRLEHPRLSRLSSPMRRPRRRRRQPKPCCG